MTPDRLAALHRRCFVVPRPFTAAEFAGLLRETSVFLRTELHGLLLGRVVADEAELLTLAVDPEHRRQGTARRLLAAFEAEARQRGAVRAILEVDAANTAARGLYAVAGWREAGCRPGYYRHAEGVRTDAVILQKALRPF